jgi:hypothetical protein
LTRRAALGDFLAILAASLVVFAGMLYAAVTGTYDATTLLVSVLLPLAFGSALLSVRKERIALFAFLAYFWAMVDDGPVFFDSVLTWPEVTRFHPFLPRLFMNVVIHGLTALFLYLAIRESTIGTSASLRKAPKVVILTSAAFVVAYAQNIPLTAIQNAVDASWYAFDITEKSVSIFLFCFAVFLAMRLRAGQGLARPV